MKTDSKLKSKIMSKGEADPSRRRKQGVVVSCLYTTVQVVVNFLYVPIVLSTIGRDEYGIYQMVGSIMVYVVSINSILSAGVGRYYSMYKAEGNERMMENTLAIAKRLYWGLSVLALIVVGIIIPVFREIYVGSFTSAQLDECSVMLAVMAVNTVVTFNNAVNIAAINANERFVFLKAASMATLVAQPFLIILVAGVYPNAVIITLVILSMNILSSTLQRVFAQSFLQVKYTFHGWDKALVRGLLSFSVAIVLVAVADQVFWTSSNLIIAYFYGAGPVAVYAVGSQVYKAYMSAGMGVSGVFFQRVSSLYHYDHDMGAISQLFAKVGRVTFIVCSVVLGGFIVLGQDFTLIWAGEGYGESYWVAVIVMIPMTIDLIQNLGLTIMQVEDKYYFRGIIYFALAVVNVVLAIFLVPRFGILSAAASSALCMLVCNGFIMNWYYARHVGLDIKFFWREIWGLVAPFVFATSVSAVLYRLFPQGHGEAALFLIGGCVYLALYAFSMTKWGLNDYERGQIGTIVEKLLKKRKKDDR